MPNTKLIEELSKLRDQRKREGQTYRVRAYETAIASLRAASKEITSGREAMELPGIGKSIGDHIDKILADQTVVLEIVPMPSISEREQVVELFSKLHGVGPVTANAWYDKGYRTLDDIRNSGMELHESVRISLDHFEDLQARIPRAVIERFEREFRAWFGPQITFEICGSYRRGLPDSGDIDVVVLDSGSNPFELIKTYPLIRHVLGEGPKKMLATIELEGRLVRIDFERVQPDEWAYAVLYFTGSKGHNELMRARAKEKGWRLNEKSMHEISLGIEFQARTEAEIFELLGMKYLSPAERNL